MAIHFLKKSLYFLASLYYLESKVFIATARDNPTALSGEGLDQLEQLWIRTLSTSRTPTTTWMGVTDGKGFVLDLGSMLTLNKIEIGNYKNVKSPKDDLIFSHSPGSFLG